MKIFDTYRKRRKKNEKKKKTGFNKEVKKSPSFLQSLNNEIESFVSDGTVV